MGQPTAREFAHANGRAYRSIVNRTFDQIPNLVRDSSNQLSTKSCQLIAGAVSVGAVAYFVFLGTTRRRLTAVKVLFNNTVVGTSTQVGEVGLFSSPASPNRAAQTLTKLVASGTLDDLTSGTGIKGNATSFAQTIDAGTHLWAGYRVDMAGTEPTVVGLTGDESRGSILSLAAATAFTSGTTYAGGLITAALTWQCPNLVLSCS